MELEAKIRERRDAILETAARHGAGNVRVCRLVTGAAPAPAFLVEPGPNPSPFFPGGLLLDLQELLGGKIQVVTEAGLHPALRQRILAEARVL